MSIPMVCERGATLESAKDEPPPGGWALLNSGVVARRLHTSKYARSLRLARIQNRPAKSRQVFFNEPLASPALSSSRERRISTTLRIKR